MSTPDYITRLCFNTSAWKRPSGAAGKSKSAEAFEEQFGYGHEEWLFDPDGTVEIDGELWKYGYIQGIERSRLVGRKLAGQVIDVGLFTARSDGAREYIARIPELEVLDDAAAVEAWDEHRRLGHIQRMARHVEEAGGNVERFLAATGPEAMNVRFRPTSVQFDRRFGALVERSSPLYNVPMHYVLYEFDAERYGDLDWEPGPKPLALRPTGKTHRSGQDAHIADDVHDRHQNAVIQVLVEVYGERNVRVEHGAGRGRSDIEVRRGNQRIIVEVKSNLDCGEAIRLALGQLIEYAFWPPNHSTRDIIRLVVAAPAELTMPAQLYLDSIRTRLRLKLDYVQTFEDPSRIVWKK